MKVFEISELLRGKPEGDGEREIHGVAALDAAGPAELSYAEGPRALERAAGSRAGCLLVPEGVSLPGRTTIAVRSPKLALVRAAEALHPASPLSPGIHPTAVVAPGAQLAPDVSVGAHVVIESRVSVGPGTRLSPAAAEQLRRALGFHLPVKFGFLFSRNALMPSFLSSVAKRA
ncbi:MAG: hypothetical protein LAO24_18975 [Acidobacteriia bacterium]|nr:hypothetical protein [Terriglobia bacterium]